MAAFIAVTAALGAAMLTSMPVAALLSKILDVSARV
jgi:hypothetical protein